MDLKARVDVNCERKDGKTDGQTDGRKTGCLCHTLLKQVRQKPVLTHIVISLMGLSLNNHMKNSHIMLSPLVSCLPICKHFCFGITPYSFHQMMPNFCP